MTRHLAAVPDPDAVQCLLCGRTAETYADLCNSCARAFSSMADRIAAGVVADLAAVADPVLAGQLTLDDQDAEELEGEGPLPPRLLAQVNAALYDGEWDHVTTRTLERAWVFHSPDYSLSDLRAMRAVVQGRASQ